MIVPGWNEICAMSRLLRGMLNIPSEGNLVQRDGSILLGLEVRRGSGGFTLPAQLNVFDFLFNRGGMLVRDDHGTR